MASEKKERASFSGRLGYVLATAGSAVGLGNIWRFPYLAAKYGGGIFILVYIILAATFGYTMIVTETALGRKTRKSPVGAFSFFTKKKMGAVGGWMNAVIPMIIVPYYSVIGGWVLRYFVEYVRGNGASLAEDTYFSGFIGNAAGSEIFFLIFAALNILVIGMGVNGGVERVSTVMMPSLIVLAVIVAVYSVTRPGALAGVHYIFVPDFSKFSIMTVVAAMGQMFYSLSIAMGILYTYGSYMKDDVDVESSSYQVVLVDSCVAILAALMIIPSVFAFSGADAAQNLQAGPSLLFITLPKVFASMAGGRIFGILFFLMVLFAALTSSISLLETSVSTLEDEAHMNRTGATVFMFAVMIVLGSLSSFGYNILSGARIVGMQFLDFFDFLSNSLMMPISAFTTCLLVLRAAGVRVVIDEVGKSSKFRMRKMYSLSIRYFAPVLLVIIFLSSVLSALGIISM
ncbi:MAG: sodium-dependent transporter [Lachnospiraceae bacterium]|nr:sodium-dependent transporter [Lachnospiraceae bacterium]